MATQGIIDGKDIPVEDVVVDTPGGFMILKINGEDTLIPLDNKQVNPIREALPESHELSRGEE